MHTADQLLLALGRHAGLNDDLTFDDSRCARLIFDGTLAIDLEASVDDGPLHVYSVLGTLPDHDRETLLQTLLEANLFGTDTAGAALSIDGDAKEIIICRQIDVAHTTEWAFISVIEKLLAAAEHWKAELSKRE